MTVEVKEQMSKTEEFGDGKGKGMTNPRAVSPKLLSGDAQK